MPTQDKTEHDFLQSDKLRWEVTLKEFLVGIINERERKYEQRMESIDKKLIDADRAVKEALASANETTRDALAVATANTKDALATANANIATALISIDKRFESVNEFRSQLSDQQETFARKADVDATIMAFEKATLKAEAAVEKRFDAVNDFRSQMAEQQLSLVRKTEVDIRFDALDKKLDTAVTQLQLAKGRESGLQTAWGVLAIVISLLVSGSGVIVSALLRP